MAETQRCYYFGCQTEAGHYLINPGGTPVVCVGLGACHDALAGRRHDLPLVLYSGAARLDAQRLAATETTYVPANTPISAAVWARAVASACAEVSS